MGNPISPQRWRILVKHKVKDGLFPFCQRLSGSAIVVIDEHPERTEVIL